jgi:hypothetical protein
MTDTPSLPHSPVTAIKPQKTVRKPHKMAVKNYSRANTAKLTLRAERK